MGYETLLDILLDKAAAMIQAEFDINGFVSRTVIYVHHEGVKYKVKIEHVDGSEVRFGISQPEKWLVGSTRWFETKPEVTVKPGKSGKSASTVSFDD
jgi:hypothetical protein